LKTTSQLKLNNRRRKNHRHYSPANRHILCCMKVNSSTRPAD